MADWVAFGLSIASQFIPGAGGSSSTAAAPAPVQQATTPAPAPAPVQTTAAPQPVVVPSPVDTPTTKATPAPQVTKTPEPQDTPTAEAVNAPTPVPTINVAPSSATLVVSSGSVSGVTIVAVPFQTSKGFLSVAIPASVTTRLSRILTTDAKGSPYTSTNSITQLVTPTDSSNPIKSPADKSSNNSSNKKLSIALGVVFGIVLPLLLILGFFLYKRLRRNRAHNASNSNMNSKINDSKTALLPHHTRPLSGTLVGSMTENAGHHQSFRSSVMPRYISITIPPSVVSPRVDQETIAPSIMSPRSDQNSRLSQARLSQARSSQTRHSKHTQSMIEVTEPYIPPEKEVDEPWAKRFSVDEHSRKSIRRTKEFPSDLQIPRKVVPAIIESPTLGKTFFKEEP